MKRKKKWNYNGKKINEQVKKFHVALFNFSSRKYLNGTHSIPKHSPSSFRKMFMMHLMCALLWL